MFAKYLLNASLIGIGLTFSLPAASVAQSEEIAENESYVSTGLSLLNDQNFSGALEQFNLGFSEGEVDGGFYIGRMLELGIGVQADAARSITAYRQAAEAKSPLAMNRLGLMQLRGEAGVLQNFSKARALICEAAELGYDEAAFNCAELQMRGVGGEEDIESAVTLYSAAADNDHIGAMNRLGAIFANTEYENFDLTKAVSYFKLAAESGNANGLFEYGVALENGLGDTTADLQMAHVYFNLAGLAGHPGATEALARVGQQLDPEAIAAAQQIAEEKLGELRSEG